MDAFQGRYAGRTVLVTGHSGFKGGWLCCWLRMLGAKVVGFALPPEPGPSFFSATRLDQHITSVLGDIRGPEAVAEVMRRHQPEIVFHLAAQSLVRRSYRDPVTTYAANVLGTVHVLEAVRATPSVQGVVVVTSDKCYENREWVHGYREADPMGGSDPYSSSKGCAELVTAAYRRSFFELRRGDATEGPAVHSARAGNVIGGGDWAEDRLIPDCVRALNAGQAIPVRNPDAVRPWQHVLEPLSGYLWLAANLPRHAHDPEGSWNFGPLATGAVPVREVSDLVVQAWGSGRWDDLSRQQAQAPHEANQLRLDITKALTLLNWRPIYSVQESIRETMAWYREFYQSAGFDAIRATEGQIAAYTRAAAHSGVSWAQCDS